VSGEADRTSAGRLFQSRGPAVNDQSPTVTHRASDARQCNLVQVKGWLCSGITLMPHKLGDTLTCGGLSQYFVGCTAE